MALFIPRTLSPGKDVKGVDKGKWGEYRECINGSFAIGAELGLYDDYMWENTKKFLADWRMSVMNIKLYCTEYDDEGDSKSLEGDTPGIERDNIIA